MTRRPLIKARAVTAVVDVIWWIEDALVIAGDVVVGIGRLIGNLGHKLLDTYAAVMERR